ncbi:hypothetical protein IJT93_06110 [bacterium]|nr:hypothetical protein [bacterium]
MSEIRFSKNLRLILAEALCRRLPFLDSASAAAGLRDGFPNRWDALALTSRLLSRPEFKVQSAAAVRTLPETWLLPCAGETAPPAKLAGLGLRGELLVLEFTDAGLDYIVRSAASPPARAEHPKRPPLSRLGELPPPSAYAVSAELKSAWILACRRLQNIFRTAAALKLWPPQSGGRTDGEVFQTSETEAAPPWKSLAQESAALISRIESLQYLSPIFKGQTLSARKGADIDRRRSAAEKTNKREAWQMIDFLDAFHRWYKAVPLFGRCHCSQSGLLLAAAAAEILKIYSSEAQN